MLRSGLTSRAMSSIDRNLHARLIPGPAVSLPTGQRLARADADAKCRCYQVSLKIPKVKLRLGFAILLVTVKLLKMTAVSKGSRAHMYQRPQVQEEEAY
jgi:hypothetical protein